MTEVGAWRRASRPLIWLAVLLACGGGAGAQVVDTVRVSEESLSAPAPLMLGRGVTIATSSGYGGLRGFRQVIETDGSAAVLTTGISGPLFVIGAPPAGALRFFDLDGGGFLRDVGAGYLAIPEVMTISRDSILVLDRPDRSGARISVFRTTGELVASRPFPMRILQIAATPGGWMMVRQVDPTPSTDPRAPLRPITVVAAFDPATLDLRDVIEIPGRVHYRLAPELPLSPVLSGRPEVTVGPDGRTYLHRGDGYRIEVRESDGGLSRVILGEVVRRPVSDEEWADTLAARRAGIQARVDRASDPQARARIMETLAALEAHGAWVGKAEFRPVIGDLLASRDGHIMVERLDLPETNAGGAMGAPWDVIAPDGGYRGRLSLGARLEPSWFDWPFLITRESGAENTIVRWAIEPAP